MKAKRLVLTGTVLVLVGALVWDAGRHRPTGPAFGTDLEGRAPEWPAGRKTLRLATFNIHFGKGDDGRVDLARTAECLEGLDLAGLQEVRCRKFLGAYHQANWLAERLRLGWVFAPAVRRWHCSEAGNAALSRLPVRFWQRIPLPQVHDHSHRNMLLLELYLPPAAASPKSSQSLRVLITHLNQRYPAERRIQFQAASHLFLALDPPAVLMGDLNTPPEDPLLRQLLARDDVCDAVGRILGPKAPKRIDWIITRGLEVVDAGIGHTEASDHPVVWAKVRFRPSEATSVAGGENTPGSGAAVGSAPGRTPVRAPAGRSQPRLLERPRSSDAPHSPGRM